MAKFNVTDLILKVANVAVAHCNNATLNINVDLPDATTKSSSGWAEHIKGQRDYTIDVEGMIDYSSSWGINDLATHIIDRTAAMSVEFGTGTTGHQKFTGTVDASSLTIGGGKEETATWSGTLVGTGILVKATY